tara:strand:+ start:296 stop:1555 length:1260 start_codon:yes stop_codon:yes gene_type:complete
MPWIGLDDTDTLSGGCTTYEFHLLITELSRLSDLGRPWGLPQDTRLVRLWPFASKRTRGNAALALKIDVLEGHENSLLDFLEGWYASLKKRISELEVVQSNHSERLQHSPEPCLLYLNKQFPDFYWKAVRGHVTLEDAKKTVLEDPLSKIWSDEKKMSGLIGSLAAISWKGDGDCTWELTAYRRIENYLTKRRISNESVKMMSNKYNKTLLNRDPNSKKPLISPNTPCPVLYGIRAENDIDALNAHDYLQSFDENEICNSHQIWRTNQATGDHIEKRYMGVLNSNPIILKGGHIYLEISGISDDVNEERLMAFEESGNIKQLANDLKKGDTIEWMGLRCPTGEIHLERLKLVKATIGNRKRPMCVCGVRFESSGKNQPLRCKCGKTFPRLWVGEKRDSSEWKEPSSGNRRHLSKPLNRI